MSKTEKTTWFETLEMLDISLFSWFFGGLFFLLHVDPWKFSITAHYRIAARFLIASNRLLLLLLLIRIVYNCIVGWYTHFGLKIINVSKKRYERFEAFTVQIIVNEWMHHHFSDSFKSAVATTIQHTWIDPLLCATAYSLLKCIFYKYLSVFLALFCI